MKPKVGYIMCSGSEIYCIPMLVPIEFAGATGQSIQQKVRPKNGVFNKL